MRAGPGNHPTPKSIDALRQNLGTFWSEDCQAFMAHWARLREEALMPTTEAFLDHPMPDFAPNIYLVELVDGIARVRLQGSALDERWPAQLTGRDLHERLPVKVRERSLQNMHHIAAQPCGYLASNRYTTSLNRTIMAKLIQLPLAVQAGRPPRVVSLSTIPRRALSDEEMEEMVAAFRSEALTWIDLGAGVPSGPPRELFE
jgi:hypothetical protein